MMHFSRDMPNAAGGKEHSGGRFDFVALRAVSFPPRTKAAARRSAAKAGLAKLLLLAAVAMIVVGMGQKLRDVCSQDNVLVCGP